ncbi:MAG: hypothetical protein ACFE9S_15665 [Candidatus Hermodarchaeota archaeon]
MDFKDRFKGKEFWRNMNLVVVVSSYSFTLVFLLILPNLLGWFFIGLGFFIMFYITFQQYYFRRMDQRNAGRRVLAGWIDHESGLGEEYEFPIEKIIPFERLSVEDKKAVDNLINQLKENEEKYPTKAGFREFQLIYKKEEEVKKDVE